MHAGSVSADQERLWYLSAVSPEFSTTFNIGAVGRYRGPLDQAVLERAIEVLVARHGALRTCFAEINGEVIARPGDDFRVVPTLETLPAGSDGAHT